MKSGRILVVEDEIVCAMDIESKLLDLGYQVISVCTTGEEAVRKTTELHPDLILMDIVLKGKMDGIEAAQKIRMLDNNAIIFVTANNDDETLQRAKITEPYAYIQKPVSSRELHVAVEVALYKHAAQKEISTQLQQLTAMCMVDKAILNNHDPRQALRVALHQITFQLELDAAAVLLCDPISFTFNFFEGYGFRSPTYRNLCMSLGNDFSTIFSHPEQFEINQDILSSGNESRLDYDNEENFISYIVMPLYSKDKLKGILEVFRRSPIDAKPEWVEFLKALANQAAVAIDNASMLDELNTANLMIMKSYDATIQGWSSALEMRDLETEGHSKRVTEMTVKVARKMGMSEAELEHVRRGAILHDIGKMGIPDSILLKPGKLSQEEWETMKKHTSYAKDLLSLIPFLRPALEIPISHHEHWDGTGYPEGLKGEEIPLAARIFAVVDVWDALLSDRPYRKAWSKSQVVNYLHENSGSHFDPQVVELFLRMIV